jgi:hypothetical protein
VDRAILDIRKIRPQEELYIACADWDFSWTKAEIQEVIQGWGQGVHISDIAKRIHRDADEVAILIMDLIRQKRIKPRKGGAFGWG